MSAASLESSKVAPTWSQLRAWDKLEEDELRKFEKMRNQQSPSGRAWEKLKQNPIPCICMFELCKDLSIEYNCLDFVDICFNHFSFC